jgi:hypothetical protein
MMGSRPARRPDDVVIWASMSMLALITGAGAAFAAWSQFRGTSTSPLTLGVAIIMLGTGIALVGATAQSRAMRAFVWVAATAFVGAFFLAGPLFQALLG